MAPTPPPPSPVETPASGPLDESLEPLGDALAESGARMRTDRHVTVGTTGSYIRGRRVIAVVGINRYAHMPELRNAVADAEGVRDLFVGELGFEELVPHLFDGAATKEAIEELIEDQLRAALRPEDELILFFAGHGCTRHERIDKEEKTTGFIAPVDAKPEQWKSQIKIKNLLDSANSLDARCILVVLDACNSGLAADDLMWTARRGVARYQESTRKLGRKLLTSARKDQLARDDGPVPNHSLFTGTLIRGLREREMDWDRNGLITSGELALYVEQRVAQATSHAQTPGFGCFGQDKGGELFIPLDVCAGEEDAEDEPPGEPSDQSAGWLGRPPGSTMSKPKAAVGFGMAAQRSKRPWNWAPALASISLVTIAGIVGSWVWDGAPDVPEQPTTTEVDLTRARGGILVAISQGTRGPAEQAYETFCEALGGHRPPVDGVMPVYCTWVPPTSSDDLVALADDAQVKVVVLVDDEQDQQIHVRSTSHHRGIPLLAKLDGLPLPSDPSALAEVTPVLTSVAGAIGAADVTIPALDRKRVGARWVVLAEWLRSSQGHDTHEDHLRRDDLRRTLSHMDDVSEADEAETTEFYRDLADLIWADSVDCGSAVPVLRKLSMPGDHETMIRVSALLGLTVCLLEGDDAASHVDEAEGLLTDAFRSSGNDPCVRVSAIGSLSRIDRWKGGDALWETHAAELIGHDCDSATWSTVLSVRGDALVDAERWCDAAKAYGLAYGALRTKAGPLLNWAEYEWICNRDQAASRKELLDELRTALASEHFDRPQQRVSIAYMRWWLTRDPADAQRVVDWYARVGEGDAALIEGVGSDLEQEICGQMKGGECSRKILERPKRSGDEQLLRRSLGLR